ncbi:MAG: hypothetical protein DLM61_17505 [Pseudonocardiales bacterium]|nr:MAG: hypothetical protein DLM61_17505 [Pseudonocardiales bacterium]
MRPEAHRRARARAAELGVSLAEYLRRLVDADLDQPAAPSGASGLFDLGRSTGSDVSSHKDRYIGEAVDAERLPPDR